MKINFLQVQSINIPNDDFIVQNSNLLKLFKSQDKQQQKQIGLPITKEQFQNFRNFLYNPGLQIESNHLFEIIRIANYLDFDYNDHEHLKGWIHLLRSIDKEKYDLLSKDLIYEIEKVPLLKKIKKLFSSRDLNTENDTLDFLEIFGLFDEPSVFMNIHVDKNTMNNLLQILRYKFKVRQQMIDLESYLKTNWSELDFRYPFTRWIDILIGSLDTDSIATIYNSLKIRKQSKQAQRLEQKQKQQYVARKTRIPREF